MTQSKLFEVLRKHLILKDDNVMQYASYTIIVAAIIQFVLTRAATTEGPTFTVVLLLLGMLFTVNVLWLDLPDYLGSKDAADWFFLAVSSLLIVAAFIVGSIGFYPYLLFMVVAQAFSTRSTLGAGLLTAAHVLIFFGSYYLVYDVSVAELLQEGAAGVLFGIVFVITLSMAVRYTEEQRVRVEQLLEELQQTNAELRASQQRERELAATAERVRLAREIHDGLGHYLTVLNVQLQAAQKLIQREPQKAEGVIDICRQQAQEALREVRRSVAVMRQTPLDGRSLDDAIRQLVTEFDSRSPLDAHIHIIGTPYTLPTTVALTLYRAVQEGLTNTQKHGVDTRQVTVRLDYTPHMAHVTISSDGAQVPIHTGNERGSGFGLAGLRERAEQLGGQFSAQPRDEGGFEVHISVPNQPQEGDKT